MTVAVAKVLHAIAFAGKQESGYANPATLSLTVDGLLLALKDKNTAALIDYDYIYDGTVGPSIGTLGQSKRIAPSGLYIKGSLPFNFRGSGAAYSATVRSSIDRFMIASGFDATVDTTAGSEKVTYAPTAAGAAYGSLTGNLYGRGQKIVGTGMVGSVKIDSPDLSPPNFSFDMNGIGTLPTDTALASITYPAFASIQPPGAYASALSFGSLTPANSMLKKWGFDFGRKVTQRVNQNAASGFGGYAPGDRMPTMTFTLEATALTGTPFTSASAFDAYSLRDSATAIAIALAVGSVQYNRFKINLPQAQVTGVKDSNEDGVACVDITVAAFNSSQTSNDDVNVVTD